MSKFCEVLLIGPQAGHMVSHSNIKTKRRFLPNLQDVSFRSELLGRTLRLKVAVKTLRSIEKHGGLDHFLLNKKARSLTERAQIIRRKLKKLSVATA